MTRAQAIRGRVSGVARSVAPASENVAPRLRIRRALAASICLGTYVVTAVSMLVWASRGFPTLPLSFAEGPAAVVALAIGALVYAGLGGMLASRIPRNVVGWLLLVVGASVGLLAPAGLLVSGSLQVFQPVPPATLAFAWLLSTWLTPTISAMLITVGLVVPDGALLSRRWAGAGALAVLGSSLMALTSAGRPEGLIWYPVLPNPTALAPSLASLLDTAMAAGLLLMLAGLALATASLAIRYRRSDQRGRLQLRWIVLGVGITALSFSPFTIARYWLGASEAIGERLIVMAVVGSCALPVAVAIAVTRHHLFGIEAIASRTLVYVPLMGICGGLFAGSVALFQRLFLSMTGATSDAAIVLSSLVIASAFTPVRKQLEIFVERWFGDKPAAGRGRHPKDRDRSVAAGGPLARGELVRRGELMAGDDLLARIADLEARLCALEGPPVAVVAPQTLGVGTATSSAVAPASVIDSVPATDAARVDTGPVEPTSVGAPASVAQVAIVAPASAAASSVAS